MKVLILTAPRSSSLQPEFDTNKTRKQWRIQDFPEGGAWTLQGGREHAKFSRKLHEIERIWTPRGGRASLTPPLDPPMVSTWNYGQFFFSFGVSFFDICFSSDVGTKHASCKHHISKRTSSRLVLLTLQLNRNFPEAIFLGNCRIKSADKRMELFKIDWTHQSSPTRKALIRNDKTAWPLS